MKKIFCSLSLLSFGECGFLYSQVQEIAQVQEIVLQDVILISPETEPPLGEISSAALISRLQPFVGAPISTDVLLKIKEEIGAYFIQNDQPYVVIEIPEQDITDGKVRYNILKGKIGKIQWTGNRWFSDRVLSRYVHAKVGDPIDENQLLNDVSSMNRNPFHSTQLILEPGEKKGFSNVELYTKDRFPLRVFGGADNTGNPFTGNTRYFGGFNWGNAFFSDDMLTYQYTTAENNKNFWSHFGSYSSFFSWGHTLFLYGGYSQIHPHIRDFHTVGKSYQGSFRYQMPFKPYFENFTQEMGFGGDVKGMNSSLFFSDVTGNLPVSTHLANLNQIVVNYGFQYKRKNNRLSFNLEFFGMPFKWMGNQTSKRFDELRPHALPRYFYGRLYVADVWTMPHKFTLGANLRLQGTTRPLMPSEQFSLGGYNTVRGYAEQSYNADAALCANIELRFPPFKLFPKIDNALTFLGFADYGLGHNFDNDFHKDSSSEYLFSAGPGLRYEIYPYLSVRADYGFKFHKFANTGSSLGKFHFSATASY